MRILYLAGDPAPSAKGAGVRIARTVGTLRELGHEVSVFTPAGRGEGLAGVRHDTVALGEENYLERMLAFRRAAAAWLAGRDGDLVQFRGIWEGLPAIEWARARGVPAVLEAHGFPSIELPYHFPGLERDTQILEKLIAEERRVLAGADLVITVSRTSRRHLLTRGVPAEAIALVPNAVDGELFDAPAAAPAPGPPHRLFYEGTLAPWQGLPGLLEALVPFRAQAEIELEIVGPAKSAWRRELRALSRRLRVHHLVRLALPVSQAELVRKLHAAHVCVAPMPADARNVVQGCSPIKVLEYMAAARPILATRIAPLEEILEHDRDARLVRPDSPAALADGIAWMIAHPAEREALGPRAREQALARFSPERFRARLAAAIERFEA